MSAVQDPIDGPIDTIQVLFVLYPSFGAQELCGPLEVLSNAYHKIKDPSKPPHYHHAAQLSFFIFLYRPA